MAETPTSGASSKGPTPLAKDGHGSLEFWKGQITAAEEKIQRYAALWKRNVSRQTGTPLEIIPIVDTVVLPIDHANIEQKKAQLYFKNPDVQLLAAPGHDASADALQAFSAVLNEYLGPDGVDAEAMMDELLSDVLCPSGIGFSVLGLDITQDGTKPVQVGERPPMPEEMPPGAILGLAAPMVPVMEDAPNIIHQSYFWSRISPLYGLLPARFHGSNFDKAPWLGYKFEMDKAVAVRQFKLTEEEASQAGDEPDRLNEDEKQHNNRDTDVVYGYCISYKGSLYNPKVKHPEEIWRLMMFKGVDRIIVHDRPYQQYSQDGTLMGLMGHFIGVYTPRYVSDTAIPPSDVTMSSNSVGELQIGRQQMLMQRNRAKPMRQINIGLVDPIQAEKMKRGEWQELILTTTSEPIAQEIAAASFPRENFDFDKIGNRDIDRAWGFGDAQKGIEEDSKRTATELSIRSQGSDTRMEKERSHLLKWYLKQTEKLAGLILLFEDDRQFVQIAGEANAQRIVEWKKSELPIRFQCRANIDTMIRTDTERDFKKDLDTYQMTANDPHVNRVELLTQMLRKRGYDISKVITRELPEKGPEPPKVSLTVKGEDMNPSMPQFPVMQELLTQLGVKISPENVQLGLALAQKAQMMGGTVDPSQAGAGPVSGTGKPDAAHGGPAEQAEPLSKRSGDQTGKLDGMGMAGAVN